MILIIIKYFSVLCCVGLFFTNFVSCGLQFYKVSLQEDTVIDAPYDASDPNSEYYGIHATAGWQKLPISFYVGSNFENQFQLDSNEEMQGLLRAIKTWEVAVGRKLFEFKGVHKNVEGDSFKDLYSSLEDSLDGYYLDENWEKVGKSEMVLATTIWQKGGHNHDAIATSDIRFNNDFYIFGDSLTLQYDDENAREVVDMESLALHELGHLLGLAHVDEDVDAYSAMNPSMLIGHGLTARGVSKGDIERIQKIYSCQGYACNLDQVIEKLRERFSDDTSDQDMSDL